jgi:hypothetical protein
LFAFAALISVLVDCTAADPLPGEHYDAAGHQHRCVGRNDRRTFVLTWIAYRPARSEISMHIGIASIGAWDRISARG